MEAIAAFSLAVNILQVIDFTHKTVYLYNNIRNDRAADPDLNARAGQLAARLKDLQANSHQSSTILGRSTNSSANQRLQDLCETVIDTTNEIQSSLKSPGTSKRASIKFSLKMAVGMSSKISKLDSKLRELEQSLQTELLADIWSKQDAAAIQQQQNFKNLNKDVKSLIQRYGDGQVLLQDLLTKKEHSTTLASLPHDIQRIMTQSLDTTNQHVTMVAKSTSDQRRMDQRKERFLQSLVSGARNARKSAIHKANDHTFGWIFHVQKAAEGGEECDCQLCEGKKLEREEAAKFRHWIVTDQSSIFQSPIFWIRGKPGSGKSTLMKFLASDPRMEDLLASRYSRYAIYSHFIWMADRHIDGTIRGMLCSLLHQILEKDSNATVVEALLAQNSQYCRRNCPADWEPDELQQLLHQVLLDHEGFVIVFIDGLDELIAGESKTQLRDMVSKMLGECKQLRFCIASRPDPEEKLLLRDFPYIELQRLTHDDLCQVARDDLSRNFDLAVGTSSKDDTEMLVKSVVRKSEGVFLWIRFALLRLRKASIACDSVGQLMEDLDETPSELNDLYRSMWDKLGPIQRRQRDDAALILACLLEWQTGLPGIELGRDMYNYHLVACRQTFSSSILNDLIENGKEYFYSNDFRELCRNNQSQIEAYCAGLIEFSYRRIPYPPRDKDDPRAMKADFFHRSVRDFLIGEGRSLINAPDRDVMFAALLRTQLVEAGRFAAHSSGIFCEPRLFPDMWLRHYPKGHNLLTSCFELCEKWKRNAQNRPVTSDRTMVVDGWKEAQPRVYTLLKQVCQANGLSNFLELAAVYLGDVHAATRDQTLTTYLMWQRFDSLGQKRIHPDGVLGSYVDNDTFRHFANLNLAFPHTIRSTGQVIPQLLTPPEVIFKAYGFLLPSETLTCLHRLKQIPNRWTLGVTFLADGMSGCKLSACGVFLCNALDQSAERYEIIFRASTALLVNRRVSRLLAPICDLSEEFGPQYAWTNAQQEELKKLKWPKTDEKLEIMLVTRSVDADDSLDQPLTVFDDSPFSHVKRVIGYSQQSLQSDLPARRRISTRCAVPSSAQSDVLISTLDPYFLPKNMIGPFDICACRSCMLGTEDLVEVFRTKLFKDTFKVAAEPQYRELRRSRVSAMTSVIKESCSNDDQGVYDVLGHLRQQGHYIPTESDILKFVEEEHTMQRVTILNRLNQEKAKQEAWMKDGI